MSVEKQHTIKQYKFDEPTTLNDSRLFDELDNSLYAKDLWPLVYILNDEKEKRAYIGETTDVHSRMKTHLKNDVKAKLESVYLITSGKFNKSATLDIESNLIKYMSGDGEYELLNGNLGIANHNYYQKNEIYWGIFESVWDELRGNGLVKHSIEHINNSDLFKYSPYKSLTEDQAQGIFRILQNLLDDDYDSIIVEGGAGTGKTILAIFLFKMIVTNNKDFNFKEFGERELDLLRLVKSVKDKFPSPKIGLVVPMASFRGTLKKIFKNIKGLSASMVIGPAALAKEKFDIVVIDESHRLRRRVNLGAYYGAFDKACIKLELDKSACSELDWALKQSRKLILFYDEGQSIKPSDTKKEDFDKLKKSNASIVQKLNSQFRVKGGNAYVDFITKLLNCELIRKTKFNSKNYEFLLFDSLEQMVKEIKVKNDKYGLSRLIAGFSWKWISKNDNNVFDIEIGDVKLKWNATATDWINSDNSVEEVGCIHTTQGYDLNYSGVIFGNEISYDKDKNKIVILEENYYDKNGKQSIKDPDELKSFIVNIYKTIMLRAIKGTYIFICDKDLREYLSKYISKAESQETQEKKVIEYVPSDEVKPFENSIPLYDLEVAAGEFGQAQNIEDLSWVKIPSRYRASKDLFACKVIGESMNKVIPNNSVCLFRRHIGGSRNGQIVLVEHTNKRDSDSGSCYTVKEYHSKKTYDNEDWRHKSIVLRPLSSNIEYNDLVLDKDESFQVIGIFECVLK